MSLNIMIRFLNKVTLVLSLITSLNAQESLFWEIADPIVNSEFIEAYINRLIEADKFEENSIQASFSIIVQMDIADESIELKKLKAKDYQMGQYISFDMSEVEKMDLNQLNTIMSREYKWQDVSRRDLSELEQFSNVDNVFKERSFKDARDAFWWSNSQISASSAMRLFIRQKSGSLAFRLEQGLPDIGFSRQLTENLMLGLSNDIVSSYLIIPGNTMSVSNGVGHPLEGNLGFGFKFDTHKLGGQINYMDVDGQEYEAADIFSRKHLVIPASSGMLYWSNTFQINRKVDSSYGTKVKDQKKEKATAEKSIAKIRTWVVNEKKYEGLFLDLDDNGNVSIKVQRDDKAHEKAEKGRDWTTVSGQKVKAKLVKITKKGVKLINLKNNASTVLKINQLSEEDKEFIKRLDWDGEKSMVIPLESLATEGQKLVRYANSDVRIRSGKGRELKESKPYGSMRLKAGLAFTQFLHGRVDTTNQLSITDRVTGTDAIGVYAKVEGVTDDKRSKAYLQINLSGTGFKAFSLGLEHNVYKMVNIGMDCTLYPNNSFVEFQDNRNDISSSWKWYPGLRPDQDGNGGGSFLISPYVSVNF